MKRDPWLYALVASSIVMFASIFSMSYKLLGCGLLQWVIVVFLAFRTTMLRQFSFTEFVDYNSKGMLESWRERKRGKSIVYGIVSPLMLVGVTCLILMIAVLIVFG